MSPLSVPAVRVRGAVHLAVFFTLVAGITFATYRAYVDEREVFSPGLHRQLSEIATLTSNQLLSWQQERRGDAMVAASSAGLMPDLERAVGLHPEPEAQARAIHWLEAVRNNYQYSSASLTDTAGAIEVNSGQELAIPLFYQTIGREVSHSQGIFVRYYPRDLQQVMKSHWVIGAPLRSPSGQPVGSILFAADPWQYPFPVALKWPSATNSGRVWMIRQEGPNVRAIGYASGMPGQPMESIISLSDRNSPFVQAIYSGNGMADGVNPSGGRSAASTVAGPVDSGFQAVLAMIDEDEAYRPLQRTKLLLIFISALLVALCGGGVGWIWRQQVLESYRQRLNAEKERRALVGHYDYLARFANDAIIL
ncbi:MAG TPA: hypothetical protein VNH18_18735, partial [Bryobacteraceae bacterium]|nr:hypothetical protein [Bryobacteraceae bacterium]